MSSYPGRGSHTKEETMIRGRSVSNGKLFKIAKTGTVHTIIKNLWSFRGIQAVGIPK